jgi:hypothetical protein
MEGRVIGFDPDTNTGAISGENDQRYDFVSDDLIAPASPGLATSLNSHRMGGVRPRSVLSIGLTCRRALAAFISRCAAEFHVPNIG